MPDPPRQPSKRAYAELSSDTEDGTFPELENIRLQRIRDFAQELGYPTIFDACVDELLCKDPDALRSVKEMKSRDVMASILDAYSKLIPMGPRAKVAEQVCLLAETVYRKEVRQLGLNRLITGSSRGLKTDELAGFSFRNAQSAIEQDAPRLMSLFASLSQTTTNSATDPHDEINNVSPDQNSDEWVESLDIGDLVSLSSVPERCDTTCPPKRKKLVLIVSICLLMYARSQRTNLMQSVIGFYLQSSHCPKEVITVLHQFGLCV
jgi:hypothetical protein